MCQVRDRAGDIRPGEALVRPDDRNRAGRARCHQHYSTASLGLPRSPPGCVSGALLHRLDVRALDDLAEVGELLAPEAIELLRARPDADDTDVAVATDHLGALHRFPGLRGDPLHDVR